MTTPARRRKTYLLSTDSELRQHLTGVMDELDFDLVVLGKDGQTFEMVFVDPPDLFLLDIRGASTNGLHFTEVAAMLKGENVYRQIPLVLLSPPGDLAGVDLNVVEVDDILTLPPDPVESRLRLELAARRLERTMDASPLTKLPGNTSITQHLQDLIDAGQDFSMGYVDIDHFKPFNDKYGFARGDEVLMMTARLLVNSMRELSASNTFVGHVGGDDYVFICPEGLAEPMAQKTIASFDAIVPGFYDEEDRKRGSIVSIDRQGVTRIFPVMSLSIGLTFNRDKRLTHFGQASSTAMALNKVAKKDGKSSYALDRRKTP